MRIAIGVEDLTEEQAKKELAALVEALNDLDGEDYFGTEGWRHFMGFED
jgi:hypothetical protein